MVKICVTLNEGQGHYNEHMMHSHVWGSYHAKFDDDDYNIFQAITCKGQSHTHTNTLTSMLTFAVLRLRKQTKIM